MAAAEIAVVPSFPENSMKAVISRAHQLDLQLNALNLDVDGLRRFSQSTRRRAVSSTPLRPGQARRISRTAGQTSHDITVGRLANVVRVIGARRRNVLSCYFGNYYWRRLFERAALRHLGGDPLALVATPGSALDLFAGAPNACRILHVIDSLPWSRNAALLEHYRALDCGAELYPPAMIDRVRKEVALADLIVVPSAYVARQLEGEVRGSTAVNVIPFGVDTLHFSAPEAAHADMSARPTVLFVGQISLRKGVRELIEAARKASIGLNLVGPIFDRRLISSLPPNVRYCGQLDANGVAAALVHADALVLPSIDDAYGLVALEAASAGVQIILSDHCGAAEHLDSSCELFPAGDAVALGECLQRCERLSDVTRTERIRGLRESTKQIPIDWDSYADRVLESWLGTSRSQVLD